MKSKSRKLRDRAKRLGKNDPTLTSGVSRTEINQFYKKGSTTPSIKHIKQKENKKIKNEVKSKYTKF